MDIIEIDNKIRDIFLISLLQEYTIEDNLFPGTQLYFYVFWQKMISIETMFLHLKILGTYICTSFFLLVIDIFR